MSVFFPQSRNDYERKAVDEVFLKAAAVQRAAKEVEARIAAIQAAAQDKIASLGEEMQQEYSELQDEQNALVAAIAQKQGTLKEIDARMQRAQVCAPPPCRIAVPASAAFCVSVFVPARLS